MKFNLFAVLVSFYIIFGIICYGPALVESEKYNKTVYSTNAADAFLKSILWPWWLSYQVAKRLDNT